MKYEVNIKLSFDAENVAERAEAFDVAEYISDYAINGWNEITEVAVSQVTVPAYNLSVHTIQEDGSTSEAVVSGEELDETEALDLLSGAFSHFPVGTTLDVSVEKTTR